MAPLPKSPVNNDANGQFTGAKQEDPGLHDYLPGFKNGGPVRSRLNMCQWLGEEYSFRVVTRDRDREDTQPYEGCASGLWYPVAGAQVWYLPAPYWSPWRLRRVVMETSPDL